ncbi:hypothetical protein B0T25DRAFT_209459 [Lasiosphaeria hispida]|uniref:Heterokaryon incompatibility domain-containing protein n=1 Tax=Lasiosphaeria hispida TaxID=260671 RepID=A0AAJ0HIM0_9PEZI|nr:hypothetical protein B0T25DRAFT_209459 [Lasiosphaeria hispida]
MAHPYLKELASVQVGEPTVDRDTGDFKVVLRVPLESLAQNHTLPVLDITPLASARRFRLIDCDQFLHHRALTVHEFRDFPVAENPYAAISYVWRGSTVDEDLVGARFSVAGAEDGDPIGMDVLRHACAAALRYGVKHLWLDRLCIIQTSKEDKRWQIRHMYQVYKCCVVCLVFPGGIQRLVHVDEPTAWIHRGWTLQEALAPPRVEVIYAWPHGSGMYLGLYRGNIVELVPGQSAITPLRQLLALNGFPTATFISSGNGAIVPFRTTIFGLPTDTPSADRAERAIEVVIFMLKSALSNGGETFDERAPAIWRSALFRASSRPVDMVFSVMGLFGVSLDPGAFEADDRLGATAALMRAILERPGGRASWLSIAPFLPPHPRLSTFPVFPRTNVDGRVELEFDPAPEGRGGKTVSKQRLALLDSRGMGMPTGSVDEAGYLCISRRAIRVHALQGKRAGDSHHDHFEGGTAEPPRCCLDIWAIDGTGWRFYDVTPKNPKAPQGMRLGAETFAVLVGWHNQFSLHGLWEQPRFLSAMLVREHASGRYHVESYFELSDKLERWVDTWEERALCIGGPGPIRDASARPDDLDTV